MSIGATTFAADKLTLNGDIRFRFDNESQADTSSFYASKYRVRLNAAYKISPEFTFNSRISMGESLLSASPGVLGVDDVQMDIASLTYKKNNFSITGGRQKLIFFEGMAFNQDAGHTAFGTSTANLVNPNSGPSNYTLFQGGKVSSKLGNITLTAFSGNVKDQVTYDYKLNGIIAQSAIGDVNVGGMLYQDKRAVGNGFTVGNSHTGHILAANTKLFHKYLYVGAEYDYGAKYMGGNDDKAWRVQIKTPDNKKTGDMQYNFDYRKVGLNALDDKLSNNTKPTSSWGAFSYWGVGAKRQMAQNVYAQLWYEQFSLNKKTVAPEDHLVRLEVGVNF